MAFLMEAKERAAEEEKKKKLELDRLKKEEELRKAQEEA